MKITRIIAVLAAGLVASTAHSNTISRTIPVDDTFHEEKLAYRGSGRHYTFMMKFIVVGGKLELCGIGAYQSLQFRTNIDRGMKNTVLKINGRPTFRGLDYFAEVPRRRDLKSGTANCRSTGVAPPSDSSGIEFDWGNFTAR